MSWHFSQALVEAYSADTCSAGAPSAPLSGSPIPQAFLSPDRMKAFSRLSRFGTTCKPLTDDLGEALLTWFRADSLAKTSAQQAKAQESTESAAECGRTWHESFARWDRDTASWKTPQCSLLADLDEFSETWPRWGMMRDGECWAQSMPAHLTNETESGLWPTPRASANENRQTKPSPSQMAGKHGLSLCAVVNTPVLWPTPRSCSAMAATISPESAWADNRFPNLETVVGQRTWPTPTAHNAVECDAPSEATLNTPTLTHQARGGDATQPKHLNPVWVEWLMGWPLGWTDLKPLETDKFPAWQHSHGGY